MRILRETSTERSRRSGLGHRADAQGHGFGNPASLKGVGTALALAH